MIKISPSIPPLWSILAITKHHDLPHPRFVSQILLNPCPIRVPSVAKILLSLFTHCLPLFRKANSALNEVGRHRFRISVLCDLSFFRSRC